MLFTRKGDDGTTKNLRGEKRVSKSSLFAEAIGTVDEVNSLLGLVKVRAYESGFDINGETLGDIVETIQQNLFVTQAEIAGADMRLTEKEVLACESIIDAIEKSLPPIKSFFVSGGTELAALFDFSRSISRRAERACVRAIDSGDITLSEHTRKYLNRLSSILYACARYSAHKGGVKEQAPKYNKD